MKGCTIVGIILNQKSIVHGNIKKKLYVKDKIFVHFTLPVPLPLPPYNHHSHCQIVRHILLFLLLLSPQNLY